MSAAPRFRLVIFVENDSAQLFFCPQKTWQKWPKSLPLTGPFPEDIQAKFSGEPVLVVVSDTHNGHLQITQPNKKKDLAQEVILQLLEDEYDIDTAAYQLGWKQFPINRESVQLSISGVEQEVMSRTTEWLLPIQPKKTWFVPFAWFASVLTSVDPAFVAVENGDSLYLAHLYLGVDDARVLSMKEVEKYVAARQKERKETHLLYAQATASTMKKLDKALAKLDITVQPLLPDSKDASLLAMIQEVISRGSEKLPELLHFAVEGSESVEPIEEIESVSMAVTLEEVGASDEESEPEEAASEEGSAPEESDLTEVPNDEQETLPEESEELAGLQPPVPPLQPPVLPGAAAGATPRVSRTVEVIEEDEEELLEREPLGEDSDPLESESNESEEDAVQRVVPEEKPAAANSETTVVVTKARVTHPIQGETNPSEETDAIEDEIIEDLPEERSDVLTQLKGSGVHSNNMERFAPVEAKRSWKGPILVFFLVVILTAAVGGAVFWSQQGAQLLGLNNLVESSPTPIVSPSPTVSPLPSATPSASPNPDAGAVDKEELTVLVVNATGVNGLAGRISSRLSTAGWENVQAGNATGTYADGATYVSEELDPAVIAALEEDLGMELATTADISEARASQFDIVIVLADGS